jgi:hypothetical protein
MRLPGTGIQLSIYPRSAGAFGGIWLTKAWPNVRPHGAGGCLGALDCTATNTICSLCQNSLSRRGGHAGRRLLPNYFLVPSGAVPSVWRRRYRRAASCTSATVGLGAWCIPMRLVAPAGGISACLLGRRSAWFGDWATTARAGGCSMLHALRKSSSCTPPSCRARVLPAGDGPWASSRQRLKCLHATSFSPKWLLYRWRRSSEHMITPAGNPSFAPRRTRWRLSG